MSMSVCSNPGQHKRPRVECQNCVPLPKASDARHPAVLATLTFEWSQGQVEGQIHRLKLLKRQAYGRAGFDLLRHRVLARSA